MALPKKLPPDRKVQLRGGRTVTAAEARKQQLEAEGAAFAEARITSGRTQAQAAKLIGVAHGTLRNWEQGLRELPVIARGYAVVRWGADPRELGLGDLCPCCIQPWPKKE